MYWRKIKNSLKDFRISKKSIAIIFPVISLLVFLPSHFAHADASDMWSFFTGGLSGIISTLLTIVIFPIVAFYDYITGVILDFSLNYSVYGSGFTMMDAGIRTVWVLMRDTANVAFIFLLLYAGIKQILYQEASKKILSSIVIAAVLVNFSMFITRVMIDASNMVGTAIYNQISGGADKGDGVDLSGYIMTGLRVDFKTVVSEINMKDFSANPNDPDLSKAPEVSHMLLNTILIIIKCVVILWVFIILSAMLIGRFVMLVLLLATSPIGFVGNALPILKTASTAWWKSLTDLCLMLPTLMFFLLLTIRLSENIPPKGGGFVTDIFYFLLVAFLLFKTVSVTKSLSGPMGEYASKIAGAATGLALSAATGGVGALARTTIGRGATGIAESKAGQWLKERGAKGGFGGGLANLTLKGVKGTANASFDTSNMAAAGLGHLSSLGGVSNMIDKGHLSGSGKYGKESGYSGMLEDKKLKTKIKTAEYEKYAEDMEKKEAVKYDTELAKLRREKDKTTDPAEIAGIEAKIKEKEAEKNNNTSSGIDNQIKTAKDAEGQRVRTEIRTKNNSIGEKNEEKKNIISSATMEGDAKVKQIEEEKKKKRKEMEDLARKAFLKDDLVEANRIEGEIDGELKKIDDDGKAELEDIKKKKEQSLEKIKKEIDQLEKEKGEIKKKTDSEIEKEVENEIKNGDNEEHKRILQRRGIRKDYADSIRKKWFTLLSQADKDEIAMVAEKGTDKEKKKLLEEYYERAKAKRKEKSDYDKEHPSSSSETPPSAH